MTITDRVTDRTYEIRELTGNNDLIQYVELSADRFGFSAWEQIPGWMVKTWQWAGGLGLGAFEDGRLIGFSVSFPGVRDRQPFLWSQGLAVMAGRESEGIGLALKLEQQRLALNAGYELSRWTTMSVNSGPLYVYLHKLGATLTGLCPDMYKGLLTSALYPDEVELTWDLRRDLPTRGVTADARQLTTTTPIGEIRAPSDVLTGVGLDDRGPYLVEIPWDNRAVLHHDAEIADDWYQVVRRAVGLLLQQGYVGTDVQRDVEQRRSFILFEHQDTLSTT